MSCSRSAGPDIPAPRTMSPARRGPASRPPIAAMRARRCVRCARASHWTLRPPRASTGRRWRWPEEVRNALSGDISAEAFLRHYGLSTSEGVVLMCIAEALLRIPDTAKADELIRDKIGQSDWGRAIPDADSLLVNASTWALMLTGRLVEWREAPGDEPLDHPATAGRTDQRADHTSGAAASDEGHGRAVRDGTDHRARAAACCTARAGAAIACPTTCWARLL